MHSRCRAGEIDMPDPDLVAESGSDEDAHLVPDRIPRPLTRSTGFSSFKKYGSGESKLLVSIHLTKLGQYHSG